jgi:hypothetical protein
MVDILGRISNAVLAGVPFDIPKQWHSAGPAGIDHLLFLVTATPRNLDEVFGRAFSAAASFQNSRGIHDALAGCVGAAPLCSQEPSRNLTASDYVPTGPQSYGATLLTIEEAVH